MLMFLSIMWNVPEVIVGLTGVGIIASSIVASRQAAADKRKQSRA
jgi:hypothetical protein